MANVKLHVLADERGRIVATAQDTRATDDAPSMVSFHSAQGLQAFQVEVPEENLKDDVARSRLTAEFRVELDAPPKAKLVHRRR